MSFSNKSSAIVEESYLQCVDCGKSIIEKREKKQCKICGKILCSACHYSTFEICHQCRQDFEALSTVEKYNIMKKFQVALKAGPIFFQVLGLIFGISALVLATLFIISLQTQADMILGILAASEFPLSLFLFWVANRITKKYERNLEEVERNLRVYKSQIHSQGNRKNPNFTSLYRQNTRRTPQGVQSPSQIPPEDLVELKAKASKAGLIVTRVFGILFLIAATIHMGLFLFSGLHSGYYTFGIISAGEIIFFIFLIWLGSWIKKRNQLSNTTKEGFLYEKSKKTDVQVNLPNKRWLITSIVFSVLIGIAALTHLIIFLTSFELYVFGIIGGVEAILTIFLVWLSKSIKVKINDKMM